MFVWQNEVKSWVSILNPEVGPLGFAAIFGAAISHWDKTLPPLYAFTIFSQSSQPEKSIQSFHFAECKKMGFIVWYFFKGKYLSDSIILCNQITKICILFFFFSLFIWVQCQRSAIFNQLDPNFAKVSQLSGEPITFDTIQFHSFHDRYTELLRI